MVTRNVKDLNVVGIFKILVHFNHRRIDAPRAAAAAGGDKGEFGRVKSEKSEPFTAADRQDIVAYGISRKDEFMLLFKPFRRFFIS